MNKENKIIFFACLDKDFYDYNLFLKKKKKSHYMPINTVYINSKHTYKFHNEMTKHFFFR